MFKDDSGYLLQLKEQKIKDGDITFAADHRNI